MFLAPNFFWRGGAPPPPNCWTCIIKSSQFPITWQSFRMIGRGSSEQRWRNKIRKPSWRKGYARQRRHSKMAVSRDLGYYRTGNSTIRSADPENPSLEPNMEWIGCTVCEIFAFNLYCDLETGVWGHSGSSNFHDRNSVRHVVIEYGFRGHSPGAVAAMEVSTT